MRAHRPQVRAGWEVAEPDEEAAHASDAGQSVRGRLAVGRVPDPRRSGAADEDVVRAVVCRVSGSLPRGTAAHVATACSGVARSPRPGTGGHVSAATRAGAHGPIRLHLHERARREPCRDTVSALGLSPGADLLECRGGASVFLGEFRGALRRAGALFVANRWRAGMALN